MRPFSFLFIPIIFFYILSGCSSPSDKTKEISIQGKIYNPAQKRISVYTLNPFDEMIPLASSPLDSMGHFQMSMDVHEPMEAYLLYGRDTKEIFLEPGFKLKIEFDTRDLESSLTYEGKGAIENTFLMEMRAFNSEQLNTETETIPEFQKFFSSYQRLAKEKIDSLRFRSKRVSDLFIKLQNIKIENAITRGYSIFVSSYKNGTNTEDHNLPDDFSNFWSRLDLQDKDLLFSRDYRKILNTYIADQSERNMVRIKSEGDYEKDQSMAEKLALEEFLNSEADPEIKEYVLASNISDRLGFTGFKKTKPDFEEFMTRYQESRFTGPLKKRFAPWLKIDRGKPAPDFTGTTPEGDSIHLVDFRNYVIYIDVWASWCKPCYEEFPHSVDMRKRFLPEDPVRFMYVSIDDEQPSWIKGLDKIPDVEGVHILVENAWRSDFAEKYLVRDIPRYILIDREGKIADIEAGRPSSGEELEHKIRELL